MPNNALTLPGVLRERYLVVPDYQRPYAWEERQLDDLWQDLELMTDGATHYTGTLVVKDSAEQVNTDAGDTLTRCDVVDGQQRLTTCLLLVDRLRRALLATGDEEAAVRAENLARTFGPVTVHHVRRARLQLPPELNDHWLDTVLGDHQQAKPVLTAGERRLSDAAAYLDRRIAAMGDDSSPEDHLAQLKRLQTRVTNGLRFLVYELEPGSNAGEVFETLNDRGRGLTEMEKVKNYLLFLVGSLPPERSAAVSEQINKDWARIHESLASHAADEDLLLRAHWLATVDPQPRTWSGAASVKSLFPRERYIPAAARLTPSSDRAEDDVEVIQDELVDAVTGYVRTLRECAHFTAEFLDPDAAYQPLGAGAQAARVAASRLRRTGVTANFRPLIFAARLSHPDDGAFYRDLLDACERYAARVYVIAQRRSNAGSSRLYRLAAELVGGRSKDEVLTQIDELTWYHADDDVVRAGLGPTQNWYWRRGHKYFLYEYELDKVKMASDVKQFEAFSAAGKRERTTEHILPQHPDWDSGDWSAFTPDQHAELVGSIGNLILTDDNLVYSNHSFAVKRGVQGQDGPCYRNASLAQEREVGLEDDWTPETIERRRTALVEWALRRWEVSARPVADAAELAADDHEDEDTDDTVADVAWPTEEEHTS